MRNYLHVLLLFLLPFISVYAIAQNVTLSGTVRNSTTGENVQAVSVTVKGSTSGTYTDGNGAFKITVPQLPAVLRFSSVGFETQELSVDNSTSAITVNFIPATTLGQEVVVSAMRTPQRILESPV